MMEVTAKRRALGRGIGALIPGSYDRDDREPMSTVLPSAVPLAAIQPNPFQPRQHFADAAIDELARSISEKGILQPLLVRPMNGGYELIAGERRFRAAQRLGLETVPVTVRDASDGEVLELALIENIQRENLNPIEEAYAYRRLIEEFELTQDAIAQRVGKDRSTVANTLRLLQLPPEVQQEIERGALSAGHARALVGLNSDVARIELAREVLSRRLTVRETEKLAKRTARPTADGDVQAAEQRLTEALRTRVRIANRRSGCGKIEIEYYSLDELNGWIDRLSALNPAMNF
jgi:ParB family transcriptional regulator, chromosome partitioning protein